jgi:hypothetical protein
MKMMRMGGIATYVIAGLDPAIHSTGASPNGMDARIKSGHDD